MVLWKNVVIGEYASSLWCIWKHD